MPTYDGLEVTTEDVVVPGFLARGMFVQFPADGPGERSIWINVLDVVAVTEASDAEDVCTIVLRGAGFRVAMPHLVAVNIVAWCQENLGIDVEELGGKEVELPTKQYLH